jgi:MFS family permease
MLPASLAIQMNQVASPYTAFTLSNSAAVLGVVSLAQGLPMLLLGLVGGVVADRLPRRTVLIASQSALGLAAAWLAASGVLGGLQVWQVVAASFVQGAAFAFNMPARQAYIAELVDRPLLSNAVGLHSATMNFCRVAGPAVAGVLLAVPGNGIVAAYVAIALMYGVALSTLVRLGRYARPVVPSSGSAVDPRVQVLEGLQYVRASPTIMALILMNLIVVAFAMPYQTLMPAFAERVYAAGASGLGLLLAASGGGALAGALAVASLSELKRPSLMQVGLAIGLAVALIAFSLTSWFPLAVALMVVVGFLFAAFSALNMSMLMSNTAPHLTGRVMSIYLLTWACMPAGALPLAWLAEQAGAPVSMSVGGSVVIVGVLLLARLTAADAGRPK